VRGCVSSREGSCAYACVRACLHLCGHASVGRLPVPEGEVRHSHAPTREGKSMAARKQQQRQRQWCSQRRSTIEVTRWKGGSPGVWPFALEVVQVALHRVQWPAAPCYPTINDKAPPQAHYPSLPQQCTWIWGDTTGQAYQARRLCLHQLLVS